MSTTAVATALGAEVDPELPIPEAAILTSTEFGVHHGSTSKESARNLLAANTDMPREGGGEGAEPVTNWDGIGGSGRERHAERTPESGNQARKITSLV